MKELLTLFVNNLLPIFLAAGAGYLLSRFSKLDPRTLSQVIFYIFSPCLIFTLLTESRLSNGDIVRMMLFSAGVILIAGALALAAGKMLRLERGLLAGVLLGSMFMNAGNFGLSATLFAFDEAALSYASLYFVTAASLAYTLGAFIASLGTLTAVEAMKNLLKIPTLYATILALLILRMGWQVPLPLARTAKILGDASIPSMLILIGMQFRTVNWTQNFSPLALTSVVRLLISPLIAWLLSPVFNLSVSARQAGILESAMPTAILTTLLATQFNAQPSFSTAVVVITTILSPLTLTPLLSWLGA